MSNIWLLYTLLPSAHISVMQRSLEVPRRSGESNDEEISSESEDNSLGTITFWLTILQFDMVFSEIEPVTANLVLTQFEKVGRTKNKWKCAFKDGIMLLDGHEHIFGKANAEFLWWKHFILLELLMTLVLMHVLSSLGENKIVYVDLIHAISSATAISELRVLTLHRWVDCLLSSLVSGSYVSHFGVTPKHMFSHQNSSLRVMISTV